MKDHNKDNEDNDDSYENDVNEDYEAYWNKTRLQSDGVMRRHDLTNKRTILAMFFSATFPNILLL